MPPLPLRNTAVKKKHADSVINRVRPSRSELGGYILPWQNRGFRQVKVLCMEGWRK